MTVPSLTEIAENLSKLLTNSVNIVDKYFDMFFSPTPMDVTLQQYDSNGNLQTYNIPNRAKDKVTLGDGYAKVALDNLDSNGEKRVLPSLTSQSGKFLTNDGSASSWSGDVANKNLSNLSNTGNAKILPSMTGQSGKFLSTDGVDASWVTGGSALPDETTITYNSNSKLQASSLVGLTASTVELNYNDGLTGSVQPQLDNKLNKQQITNCILEDLQNIKLELNNGTLTLKAGSVVCVPNGFESDGTTPKFDEVEIESDISASNTGNNTQFVLYNTSDSTIHFSVPGVIGSGTTPPVDSVYYNTAENKIHWYRSGVAQDDRSFPIAIVTSNTTQITSIDQTFQSIGYIGSTVFVRKGLKVLIPDGRNADGSLKNIEVTTSKVNTLTCNDNADFVLQIRDSSLGIVNKSYYHISEIEPTSPLGWTVWYKPSSNLFYLRNTGDSSSKWEPQYFCNGQAFFTHNNGVISNFKPYTATNILKYSDKSQISGWGMPSTRYINLTLGASGSTYTALANGWFSLAFLAATSVQIYNNTAGGFFNASYSPNANNALSTIMPVRKGDVVQIYYTKTTDRWWRFYYAEGETN